jgi:hypothetical protein
MNGNILTMPAEEYHRDPCPQPSLSNSISKILLANSPAHAWTAHPRLNPNFEPEEKTSFDRGSAAHALLLEGEDRMTVINADSYRTKLAQEQRDAARAIGKHPILEKDYDAVFQMVTTAQDAIRRCDDLGGITLADGTAEQVLCWQESGIWLRSRLDWRANDGALILDYKTTATSANPEEWQRTMLNGWGDLQPAFYLRGNQACGGPADAKFVWLVQEVTPPFACAFIGATPALLALGNDKVEMAKDSWAQCVKSGIWPAYSPRIHWIEPPAWAESKWQERNLNAAETREGIPYDPAKLYGGIPK